MWWLFQRSWIQFPAIPLFTLGRLLHTSCVTNSTGQKDITVFSAAGKITMDFSSKHYCKKLNSVSTACSTLVFNAFKVYPCRLHYDSEVLCWQYHSLLIAMTLYSDTYVTVLLCMQECNNWYRSSESACLTLQCIYTVS